MLDALKTVRGSTMRIRRTRTVGRKGAATDLQDRYDRGGVNCGPRSVPVRPGDGFVTAPQVFKVKDGRPPLADPVWVDLFTGRVCDFPKAKVSASPDAVYYMSVPGYDSPCLLVERAALDLMK